MVSVISSNIKILSSYTSCGVLLNLFRESAQKNNRDSKSSISPKHCSSCRCFPSSTLSEIFLIKEFRAPIELIPLSANCPPSHTPIISPSSFLWIAAFSVILFIYSVFPVPVPDLITKQVPGSISVLLSKYCLFIVISFLICLPFRRLATQVAKCVDWLSRCICSVG